MSQLNRFAIPADNSAPAVPAVVMENSWGPERAYASTSLPNYYSDHPGRQANGWQNRGKEFHSNNGRFRGRRGWNQGRGFSRGRGNSTFKSFPDKKERSREHPETKHNFYCCSCERGFKTQEQMDEHNKEHIVCGLDGCLFEAHTLVVTKHIRMQHEGNLYHRLKNLNTPEDIEKWRQERKKNYPTSDKAQQKEEERKEKVDRREICGISSTKSSNSCQPPSAIFRYKINKHDPSTRSYMECQRKLRTIEYEQSDEWMRRPFAPDLKARHIRVPFFSMNQSKIVYLENFYLDVKRGKDGKLQKQTKVKWKGFKARQLNRLADSESETEDASIPISDDDEDYNGGGEKIERMEGVVSEQLTGPSEKGFNVPNKLSGSLMLVDYSSASDSEQEDQEFNVKEIQGDEKTVPDELTNDASRLVQSPVVGNTSSDHDSNTLIREFTDQTNSAQQSQNDVKSDTTDTSCDDAMVIEEFRRAGTFKDKPIFTKPLFKSRKGWLRSKLLETLLQDQIRKERNILLQACRFVRENNFFGNE